jgi:hypothetical protein
MTQETLCVVRVRMQVEEIGKRIAQLEEELERKEHASLEMELQLQQLQQELEQDERAKREQVQELEDLRRQRADLQQLEERQREEREALLKEREQHVGKDVQHKQLIDKLTRDIQAQIEKDAEQQVPRLVCARSLRCAPWMNVHFVSPARCLSVYVCTHSQSIFLPSPKDDHPVHVAWSRGSACNLTNISSRTAKRVAIVSSTCFVCMNSRPGLETAWYFPSCLKHDACQVCIHT